MRIPTAGALGAMVCLANAASALVQETPDAGASQAAEESSPDRLSRVSEAIRVARGNGCASAPQALKAQFDVSDAYCAPELLLTSYPPKQRLAFTMDGRRYIVDMQVFEIGSAVTAHAREEDLQMRRLRQQEEKSHLPPLGR